MCKLFGDQSEMWVGRTVSIRTKTTGMGPGLEFVNRLGALAEVEGHHPDIYLAWGKVRVDIWTHKIDGLTESDFILAAKTDDL